MNIIYFNPDEMRADVLGCYGHPLVKTPNIDQFASEGVRFDNCHVQHTVCSPSRCSFMTGWYPHNNGHRTLWHLLRPWEPNTLKYLKEAGYDVHIMGKNDLLAADSEKESTTEIHKLPSGVPIERLHPLGEPGDMSFLYKPVEGHFRDYHIIGMAIDFLKNRKKDDPPFMLYLPASLPHCPYTCPQPWYDMYDPNEIPDLIPAELKDKPDFHYWIRKYRELDKLHHSELKKIMAVYLGMVSYVDHLFGKLMTALKETGLIEDTSVFFFSDHGDWAGDYGLVEKWPSALDDKLTRIPMIVKTPGGAGGHVVSEPMECFDIMPTTLELAGVTPRHTHHAKSMIPQLNGERGEPNRAVFAEGGYDLHEPRCFEGALGEHMDKKESIYHPKSLQQQEHPETVCRSTMIRTSTHKLIRRPNGIDELYDLASDPGEENNLCGDPAYSSIKNELQERMLDWYIHTSDAVPYSRDDRRFSVEHID